MAAHPPGGERRPRKGRPLTAGTPTVLGPCDPTKPDDVWILQADNSLVLGATGPAAAGGLCLDDPNGITTNGTQLRIWPCNGAQIDQTNARHPAANTAPRQRSRLTAHAPSRTSRGVSRPPRPTPPRRTSTRCSAAPGSLTI